MTALTLDERRARLQAAIAGQLAQGARIESQTDTVAVLVFGRRPNHLLHFLIGVFTCGAWWIVWLILAAVQSEVRHTFSVSETGEIVSTLTRAR